MYQVYGQNWNAPEDPGYGFNFVTPTDCTTNIDRIASEGVKFTRAYTASAMCSPSRLALLTGRYPSRGSYAIDNRDPDSDIGGQIEITVPKSKMSGPDYAYNLATALKSLNYTTGAFGKWHLSSECDYTCDYAMAQDSVRLAGFDRAEAI